MRENFQIDAQAVRDLGLRDAKDHVIFEAARTANAIIMSKDEDFRLLVERLGPPPQVLWVTCGNTSNERLQNFCKPVTCSDGATGERRAISRN
jgi:predicted nuclease of predicted toxin-antitoxin system